MALLGRNINVISLLNELAIGMVVDNAIVALENIFRHRQMETGPSRYRRPQSPGQHS